MFPCCADKDLKICITVPARNEEKLIEQTLAALHDQYDPSGEPVDKRIYEVLVLANNCKDKTYERTLGFAAAHPSLKLYAADCTLGKEETNVGICRRMLMDTALERLTSVAREDEGIIVSTDADTQVDPLWIHHTLAEFKQGCEVVGGRIIAASEDMHAQLVHSKDETYRLLCSKLEAYIDPVDHDPWPRHFQCFGPSTAVRCDIYRKVGGMPLLPFLEDAHFRKNLMMMDAKIRHSPEVKVYSSGRLEGRVSFGFSKQLQLWKNMHERGEQIMVENADAVKTKCLVRKKLRYYFRRNRSSFTLRQMESWCNRLFIPADRVLSLLERSDYFGAFWEELLEIMDIGQWTSLYPLVSIDEAIERLEKEFYDNRAA